MKYMDRTLEREYCVLFVRGRFLRAFRSAGEMREYVREENLTNFEYDFLKIIEIFNIRTDEKGFKIINFDIYEYKDPICIVCLVDRRLEFESYVRYIFNVETGEFFWGHYFERLKDAENDYRKTLN